MEPFLQRLGSSIDRLFGKRIGGWLRFGGRTGLNTVHLYGEIDGEQRAASFAYYVLFSIFPLCALILTTGSAVFGTADVVETVKGFLPISEQEQKFIWENVHRLEQARGGVSAISVAILLWSSLRFFQALVRGVNRAWHTVEIPWWQVPLKNLLMLLIIGSALFVGLLIPALLQAVRNILVSAEQWVLHYYPQFNLGVASMTLDLSRYILGGLVLFYCFSLLYMLAPRRRVYFRQVWLASIIVTVALQACQVAFVNYLPHLLNYGIYGAVGGLMLLLFWVYISGILIILGGCLCVTLDREWNGPVEVTPTTRGG